MTIKIPQGMLPLYEALDRLVRRKYRFKDHTDRKEGEEAWREVCKHILEGRIRPYGLTESGESYEADCAQFVTLQERYIFFADRLQYKYGRNVRFLSIDGNGPLADTLRDVHGNIHRHSRLFFLESELGATFGTAAEPGAIGVAGPPEKPSFDEVRKPDKNPLLHSRIPELKAFLIEFTSLQKSAGKPNNHHTAWKAAENHFNARIPRELVRKLRRKSDCLGQRGRPRKPAGNTARKVKRPDLPY